LRSRSLGVKLQTYSIGKIRVINASIIHWEVKGVTSWVVLIFAVLIATGGVMGYVKAGSTASLAAGLIAGILLVVSAVAMMKGAFQAGWWIALVVTILLLVRFGMAAMKEFKMMPGGLVIIMGLIVLAVLITQRGR
jgi:uncharacterized membrane protein (UPF0136 family)